MSAKHDVHNGWDTFLLQDSTQSNCCFQAALERIVVLTHQLIIGSKSSQNICG